MCTTSTKSRCASITASFQSHIEALNCHHNYVQMEHHFGEDVYVTRKGAVSAKAGELGIIPGSMGARSYIGSPPVLTVFERAIPTRNGR